MTAVVGRRAGIGVALLALVGALCVAVPRVARADTPSTGVDLSQYSLVGRYDLPEPTRTTPPADSLLAQEASSVTYDWDTDTLFVVGDGGTSVVQVSKSGKLVDSMTLPPGDSPQGTTFFDTEAITYVGDGKFVLGEERDRQVDLFTYVGGGVLTRSDVQTVKLGTTIGNTGIEGISYDPQTSTADSPGFVVVKETSPESIFQTNIDFAARTATNGSPTTDESTNLFDPSLAGLNDFSDVFALSNLPNLTGPDSTHLLVISQESGKIVNVDRSGNVESSLTISDPTSPISVADETHEGVTMDRDGRLYTVSEDGGGDTAHPQLWVYAPPSVQPIVPRMTISEVAPWGSGTSTYGADWFEVTNTGAAAVDLTGWKMDDNSNSFANAVPLVGVSSLPAGKSAVFFEDPGGLNDATVEANFAQAWFGSSTLPNGFLIGHYGGSGVGLSTSGDAVNFFDAAGDRVTGVSFGASPSTAPLAAFDNREGLSSSGPLETATATALSAVGVNGAFLAADGAEIGSPGGVATTTPPPPPPTSVIVSEVAPWGSGNSPYAVDWFEVTNTGTSAVDLTGWKMDDNSNLFANAVPLLGLSTLPAGKSAVFFEDTGGLDDAAVEASFAQAWFGSSTLPTGFLIGHYGGSGVGLSTGGDAVNVFDAAGDRVTGIAFGASPSTAPFASFDNMAGLGSTTLPLPTVSTLSAVGVNGAFLAADGAEIGSPDGATPPPPPDTTPPTIVATATPTANANGWNNTSVTVAYTCTDAGSGVDASAGSLGDDVLTASGTATGTCVDRAGNVAHASYTAQIDTIKPTVTYSGNAGSYGILSTIAITCSAADALSGVATTTCANANGAAWSFGAGAQTLSARATDKADNVGSGSTTFTVTVKPTDLSTLTTQFVRGSAQYQSSGVLARVVVAALVSVASNALLDFIPSAKPAVKAQLLATYAQTVHALASGGWLTTSQATTLIGLAGAI